MNIVSKKIIGEKSIQRILIARKVSILNCEDLRKIGVVLKREQYFITYNGKYYENIDFDEPLIRNKLTPKEDLNIFTNIKERENLRLQSRMMPKRYRHNMVEVKENK